MELIEFWISLVKDIWPQLQSTHGGRLSFCVSVFVVAAHATWCYRNSKNGVVASMLWHPLGETEQAQKVLSRPAGRSGKVEEGYNGRVRCQHLRYGTILVSSWMAQPMFGTHSRRRVLVGSWFRVTAALTNERKRWGNFKLKILNSFKIAILDWFSAIYWVESSFSAQTRWSCTRQDHLLCKRPSKNVTL